MVLDRHAHDPPNEAADDYPTSNVERNGDSSEIAIVAVAVMGVADVEKSADNATN
jgi:hypothetical protein